jgi:hypothetical protein
MMIPKASYTALINRASEIITQIKSKGFESVCICGSSKFCDYIAVVKWQIEKEGIMATGLHYLPQWYVEHANWEESTHGAEQECVADILDALHLKKIDKYDCVLVVNPNSYIGERTTFEIGYAEKNGKTVFYFVEPKK